MDLSIIIPAYNEEHFIGQCLSSIDEVLRDSKLVYEVLLVDNGSNDRTSYVASAFSGVNLVNIARTSVSQARNYGARKSQGQVLAFIDADVVLKSSWGAEIEEVISSGKTSFVTGCQYGVRDKPSWIEKFWFGNMKSTHINGGNLIVSRNAFFSIGGFDPSLKTGEDVDFCNKASLNPSIEYTLNPSFECVHLGYPTTICQFAKRELWHGEGDFRSLNQFRKSKIAKISVVYALVFFFMLCALVLQEWYLAFIILIFFIVFNYLIVCVRFGCWMSRESFFNSFLNCIYFFSRFSSLFNAIKSRNRLY